MSISCYVTGTTGNDKRVPDRCVHHCMTHLSTRIHNMLPIVTSLYIWKKRCMCISIHIYIYVHIYIIEQIFPWVTATGHMRPSLPIIFHELHELSPMRQHRVREARSKCSSGRGASARGRMLGRGARLGGAAAAAAAAVESSTSDPQPS